MILRNCTTNGVLKITNKSFLIKKKTNSAIFHYNMKNNHNKIDNDKDLTLTQLFCTHLLTV